MTKVSPPFKLDLAGAFCVPRALRDARGQYQDGQMSRQALRAIEDAEIRNLVERLKRGVTRLLAYLQAEQAQSLCRTALLFCTGLMYLPFFQAKNLLNDYLF